MKKIILCISMMALIGCGAQTSRDRLGDAQICLDGITTANPDYSDTCIAKIADVQTAAGDGIRCSGAFVKQGFTDASQLINTFSTISGGLSSSNTAAFLNSIIFDARVPANLTTVGGANTYYNYAKASSGYCASGGLKVGTLITTFSFMGNAIVKEGCDGGCTCGVGIFGFSGADSVCLATYLGGNATAKTQLYSDMGTLVINSYLVSCTGTTVNQSLCDNVSTAVTQGGGTSNPTGVGKKFLSTVTGLPFP